MFFILKETLQKKTRILSKNNITITSKNCQNTL